MGVCCKTAALGASGQPSKCRGWTVTQRKGLVAIWNNRKTDRDRTAGQGVKERKRLGNTGKREGKQKAKRESG